MALLNYTTSVAVEKTLAEVQRRLVGFGAARISVVYGTQSQPVAVEFSVRTADLGEQHFRLPANLPGVEAALRRQYKARKVERRHTEPSHAARVAWRIVKDWLDVELARVEAGISPLDEALCAYLVGRDGRTVHQLVRDQLAALPAPGRPE